MRVNVIGMGDVDKLQFALRETISEVVDNEGDYTLHEIELALQKESQLFREERSSSKQDEMDA